MKKKVIVIAIGVVGSLMVAYGSIVQSRVGFVGLFLIIAAIVAALYFRRAPLSARDERNAQAAVIASY